MAVIEGVAGLKAAFLTITPPAGVTLNSRVWAWSADRNVITYSTFPFILCARVLNEDNIWRPVSQGVGFHLWPAEVLICLNNWSSLDKVSADDEAAADQWELAIATVMFGSRGLGGTAIDIGNTEALFTTRIGEMGWLTGQAFFGIYVRTWVTQEHNLPSI